MKFYINNKDLSLFRRFLLDKHYVIRSYSYKFESKIIFYSMTFLLGIITFFYGENLMNSISLTSDDKYSFYTAYLISLVIFALVSKLFLSILMLSKLNKYYIKEYKKFIGKNELEIKNKIICIKNLQYELNLKIDDVKYKTSYNAYTLSMNEYKEVLFFINMSELDQDDKEFINNNFNEIRFI